MARVMKDSGVDWIGEIPDDWKVARLKDIKSNCKYAIVDGPFGSAISTGDYVESGVPLTRIVNLNDFSLRTDNFVYITPEHAKTVERSSFYKGDIIFAKTGATVGKCAINSNVEKGILSSSCVKITLASEYNQRYFYYWFYTNQFIESLKFSCNGTTRDTINLTPFSCLYCPIPTKDEQQKIVEFLNKKCSEIDSVLTKTRESIEEYKKLKQSIITQAVTKGIRPNRKMKDSGIEWIGEIPEDWETNYLSQIFEQVKNKNNGLIEKNLMSLSYGKIIRKSIDTTFGLLPENFEGYNIIEKDDIVLRLTDLQNDHKSLRVGLSKEKGIITSAYLTIRIKNEAFANYYYYLLHTFDIEKGFYGMGAGVRQGLNWSEVRNLMLITPNSVEEQKEICSYLDKKCSEIDTLVSKKEQLITELETYKKSLIYEYVTGKKEVK